MDAHFTKIRAFLQFYYYSRDIECSWRKMITPSVLNPSACSSYSQSEKSDAWTSISKNIGNCTRGSPAHSVAKYLIIPHISDALIDSVRSALRSTSVKMIRSPVLSAVVNLPQNEIRNLISSSSLWFPSPSGIPLDCRTKSISVRKKLWRISNSWKLKVESKWNWKGIAPTLWTVS